MDRELIKIWLTQQANQTRQDAYVFNSSIRESEEKEK